MTLRPPARRIRTLVVVAAAAAVMAGMATVAPEAIAHRAPAMSAAAASASSAPSASSVPSASSLPNARSAPARYVDPVAQAHWGLYTGGADGLYPAYLHSSGARRRALGYEALHAHARWYGTWIAASDVRSKVAGDIAAEQLGDPTTQVWMATFALYPHGEANCRQPITLAERAHIKRWINQVAKGIGSAHAVVVVEPDLPGLLNGWRPRVRERLARYEVHHFAALPNTVVYLDAGSADWRPLSTEIPVLRASGIAAAHGFELGSTHHSGLGKELRYGRAVSRALSAAGVPGKHFVVDTSDNGSNHNTGYTWKQFYTRYPRGDYNDPPGCTRPGQRVCVSLGVPPTTDVANPQWGLRPALQRIARSRVDAYMWVERPWMADNDRYFDLRKAIAIYRSSPFA